MLGQTFQSCKYSVIVYRTDTLCEHRMYFMKASEDRLPSDRIWLSDMPWAAAVVAAPIQKLCDLNCLGQKLQVKNGPMSIQNPTKLPLPWPALT